MKAKYGTIVGFALGLFENGFDPLEASLFFRIFCLAGEGQDPFSNKPSSN